MARGASLFDLATTPFILAQKDALRPASASVLGCGAGAFRFEPVSRLAFARPLAVRPAPERVESFSPRETERLLIGRASEQASGREWAWAWALEQALGRASEHPTTVEAALR